MSNATAHAEARESFHELIEAAEQQGGGDEIVVAMLHESAELIQRRQARGGTLSDEQVEFLIESGVFTPEDFAEVEGSVARGELAENERTTRLVAVSETLSAGEVAALLDVDQSRIRHRQAKGMLFAFRVGRKRRYPTWQFTGEGKRTTVLPGLATLVKAFPADMHPASIRGFMTTPQQDLRVAGEMFTPVDWLAHGGDPRELVTILDSFLQS